MTRAKSAAHVHRLLQPIKNSLYIGVDYSRPPAGLRWRSSTLFILATVGVGLSTDLFLYGLVVPILPFMLQERLHLPPSQIQSHVDGLLAAYAGASMLFSPVAGYIADRTSSRQLPFLTGLLALLAATVLLDLAQSLSVLFLARVLQGVSAAVVWTVGLALCLDTVGPDNLGKVIGSIFSFISVGALAAPVLGGLLYNKTGYAGVFGLGGAILGLDFVMRLLVIEKRVAARYAATSSGGTAPSTNQDSLASESEQSANDDPSESSPLISKAHDDGMYDIPDGQPFLIRKVPVLYCFRDPALITAQLVALVQATLVGTFDATVPKYTQEVFGFDALKAGLLFIPLGIADLVLGPVAGWAVDRFGSRPMGVFGFAWLVPVLACLRVVQDDSRDHLIVYCALLALAGVGLAAVGAPSVVEAGAVVQRYHKANPEFFGENGPYAQLYSVNSMVFAAGLTIGPLLSGGLKDSVGYGNMNSVIAGICAITAAACWAFLGRIPKARK